MPCCISGGGNCTPSLICAPTQWGPRQILLAMKLISCCHSKLIDTKQSTIRRQRGCVRTHTASPCCWQQQNLHHPASPFIASCRQMCNHFLSQPRADEHSRPSAAEQPSAPFNNWWERQRAPLCKPFTLLFCHTCFIAGAFGRLARAGDQAVYCGPAGVQRPVQGTAG